MGSIIMYIASSMHEFNGKPIFWKKILQRFRTDFQHRKLQQLIQQRSYNMVFKLNKTNKSGRMELPGPKSRQPCCCGRLPCSDLLLGPSDGALILILMCCSSSLVAPASVFFLRSTVQPSTLSPLWSPTVAPPPPDYAACFALSLLPKHLPISLLGASVPVLKKHRSQPPIRHPLTQNKSPHIYSRTSNPNHGVSLPSPLTYTPRSTPQGQPMIITHWC
jgi:hypothetical protein